MGSIQRQIEAEERRPDCTGITATYCPVHGDCTCPRPTDTGHEPIEYLNAGGCPLHAPSSDHGEGPGEVERLRDENDNLRHLLTIYLPPHSGYCATVECDCGPLRLEADRLLGVRR